jgi:hypothetical protein
MERVRPAHAMRLEIGERRDDLQLLDDRASTRVTISGSVSLCWERTTWLNECHTRVRRSRRSQPAVRWLRFPCVVLVGRCQ